MQTSNKTSVSSKDSKCPGTFRFIEASCLYVVSEFNEMINKEWPLSGQRQCRTNSTKLEEMDKENKILSVMDIILTQLCAEVI